MQPWFIWNSESSLDHGLWISELPAPTRAEERTEEVEIPGRAGALLCREGDDVHRAYVKECLVTARADADYADILTWLSGTGTVIFSNEQDRVYEAQIAAEVTFIRISNSLKQAKIPFRVNPHKGQYPPETDITLTADGTIVNPGTVASRPLVTVTFTDSCTVAFGDTEMTFTAKTEEGETPSEETIYVDCDAQIITDSGGIWEGSSTGDFWRIEPGECEVDLTNAEIIITPRWRWY